MNKVKTVLLLLGTLFSVNQSHAQTRQLTGTTPWYLGVKGGLPLGVSTFTSFGDDKTRIGFDAGLFVGYTISPIFSTELSATFGRLGMSAHEECTYWLGSDGNHYFAPVGGMTAHHYSDIYSSVSTQNYAIKLNVDLFQQLLQASKSPWRLQASPSLSAVLTNASIKQIANDTKVIDRAANIHIGIGGDLSLGYCITENLAAHLYTGVTYLTGKQFDGMPEYLHRNNFVWDSGIKLSWRFGKKTKKSYNQSTPVPSITPAPVTPIVKKEVPVVVEKVIVPVIKPAPVVVADTVIAKPVIKPNATVVETTVATKPIIILATEDEIAIKSIYFGANQSIITQSEFEKLEELLELMETNTDLKIIATGWASKTGTLEINYRISNKRSQNVKQWLIERGVTPDRIRVEFRGVDTTTDDLSEARRVDIVEQPKQNKNEK